MSLFDKEAVGEDRFLMQIGTLSGNPVAVGRRPCDDGGAARARCL